MKLKLVFLLFLMGIQITLKAQTTTGCGIDAIFKNNPELQKKINNIEKEYKKKTALSANALDLTTVYTIPLVFHVYHLGEAVGVGSNVSNAAIQATVDRLNAVFRATGVHAGLSPDIKIQFVLASFDPNCQPSNGIVRIDGRVIPNYEADGVTVQDNAMHQSLRNLSSWDVNQYINVRICHNTFYYGWAYYLDDIFMGATYTDTSVGNPSLDNFWAHEMGHSLNLLHTFEGDYGGVCPPNADPENDGDRVSDTDPHKSGDGCNYTAINACTGNPFGNVLKNIMSYSCKETFTQKQLERMRFALLNYRVLLTTSKGITGLSGLPLTSPPIVKCSPGISTLRASDCNGVYNWYASPTGGPSLSTGTIFTTPNMVSSSTYYVNCTEAVCATSSRAPYPITINPSTVNGNMCHVTAPIGPSDFYLLANFNLGTINFTGVPFGSGAILQVDNTCTKTDLTIGNTYPFSFTNYIGFEMFGKIYIDYNNDGDFDDSNELAYTGTSKINHNGNISIPTTALTNTYLRMRIIVDMANMTACNLPGDGDGSGQAVDFSVKIICNTIPAAPTTTSATSCGNSTLNLTASGCATSYNWYADNTSQTILASTAIFTTPVLTTTTIYYVSCFNGSCNSARSLATATINNQVVVPLVNTTLSTILPGESTTLLVSNCPGTIQWNNNLGSGNSKTVTPLISTNYTVTCTEGTCTSIPTLLRVTVNTSNPCPAAINHNSLINSDIYQAQQTIVSNTNLPNNTRYLAGQSILLNSGFSAGTNETFEAKITACPPLNGLMAHYTFNGNANDQSGNSYNGTVLGATLTIDRYGNPNKAYLFDGIDDHINLGNQSQSFNGQTPFSISLWVSNISNNAGNYISRFNTGLSEEYAMFNGSTGISLVRGTATQVANSNTVLPLNKWTHLSGVYDGTNLKIYINGQKITENPSGISNGNPLTNTLLGARYANGLPAGFINSKIDDVRIYNLALSDSEVLTIYKAEKP